MFICEHFNISVVCPGEAENTEKTSGHRNYVPLGVNLVGIKSVWERGRGQPDSPPLGPSGHQEGTKGNKRHFSLPSSCHTKVRYRGRSAEKTTFLGQIV